MNLNDMSVEELLDEGLNRIDDVENEILDIMADADDKGLSQVYVRALEAAGGGEKQLERLQETRIKLKLVRIKMRQVEAGLQDLTDEQTRVIVGILEDVRRVGYEIKESSREYTAFLQSAAESN